jgi:hypothetical protein
VREPLKKTSRLPLFFPILHLHLKFRKIPFSAVSDLLTASSAAANGAETVDRNGTLIFYITRGSRRLFQLFLALFTILKKIFSRT